MPNSAEHMLEFNNLVFAFRNQPAIIQGLDLRVNPGEALWIRGANGSGKSTLMRMLAGELTPNSGSFTAPPDARYLPDNVFFDEYLRISEQLTLYSSLAKRRIDYSTLGEWFVGAEAPTPKTLISNLSLGWRKRLALSLLFAQDADLYMLDEPYNGLDDEAVALCDSELRRVLASGAIVVISSHRQIEGVPTIELQMRDPESTAVGEPVGAGCTS